MLAERVESWIEAGRAEGIQQGMQQGEYQALVHIIEKKFKKALSLSQKTRLQSLSADALLKLIDHVFEAKTIDDVLNTNSE